MVFTISLDPYPFKLFLGAIYAGQVIAIMGGSGSGKSTLLNLLSGRVAPSQESSILIDGSLPLNDQIIRRHMGYVEQDDLLQPHLTVRETLIFSAMLRLSGKVVSEKEKIKRVDEMIEMLGLSECQNTKIGTGSRNAKLRGISGGERKRVSIGIELLAKPRFLFLDEPTSGLDAFTASCIISTLQKLARSEKICILLSIHQPREDIMSMFDQILLLSLGQVIFMGSLESAISHFEKCGFHCPPRTNPR